MVIEKLGSSSLNRIPDLVAIDQEHYGQYGADTTYFEAKISDTNYQIFLVVEAGKPTGFAVIEFMTNNRQLVDFSDNSDPLPSENWIHIIAFTTKTDFADDQSDKKLLKALESFCISKGFHTFCVPLSVNHPYPLAYPFFESHGYEKIGTISWIADNGEKVPCNFLSKTTS